MQIYQADGSTIHQNDIPLGTVFSSKVVAVTTPGVYRATVYARNVNGNGPESEMSSAVTVGELLLADPLHGITREESSTAHRLLRCVLQARGTLWWCRACKAPETKSP